MSAEHPGNVTIRAGVPAQQQESSFMNATTQTHRQFAFSVACYVTVPARIVTEDQLVEYLRGQLEFAARNMPIAFEVEVGVDR
jgi:hypothetical protein